MVCIRSPTAGICPVLTSLVLSAVLFQLTEQEIHAEDRRTDIVVYGGTPAGIAAAVTAGREGKSVLLVEPYSCVGGMMTNGLCHTDFRTFESITGFYLEVTEQCLRHYEQAYGIDSQQVKDCWRGTQVEPSVMQAVFQQMLKETKSVSVVLGHRLKQVDIAQCCSDGTRHMSSAEFVDDLGLTLRVDAKVFIDATYEGDLMAMADIPFAVGREAKSQFGEALAPEVADDEVQGYNFRLIVTDRQTNLVMPTAPAGYDRKDYLKILPLFRSGGLTSVWCGSRGGVYKNHRPALPNDKYDVNDVSRGLARLSLPNDSNGWPTGSVSEREAIFQKHVGHNIGLLYFLQNDSQVPEAMRLDARQFGWAKDEFISHNHVPEQLYVREARRMQGLHIYSQQDTAPAFNDVRSVLHEDAIAVGDYSHNCHGTAHTGPLFGGMHTGEFYAKTDPYQIPYGVLIPKKVDNVIVPVACSSTHVGFCALRLEPIWISLGQASGLAATMAINDLVPVQYVEIEPLQRRLHQQGSATIYVGDVPPSHADFQAVQWWGQLGGFHELQPMAKEHGQRGGLIKSQYFEKFRGHDVGLEQRLTAEVKARWLKLAGEQNVASKELGQATTRGEFIRAAWGALHHDNSLLPTKS